MMGVMGPAGLYRGATAPGLAAFRIAVLSLWLFEVGRSEIAKLSLMEAEWFSPHGPWLLLPASAVEWMFTPNALLSLQWVTFAVTAGVLVGLPGRRYLSGVMLVLLLLFSSFLRGFGHPDHAHVQLYLVTCVLACSPAWEAWSLERTRASESAKSPRNGSTPYARAFSAMAIVFSVPYLATGVYRLAKEGLRLFLGPSMLHFLARDSRVLDDFQFDFELGLWLVEHPALLPLVNLSFLVVTLAELAAPWAHLSRRGTALFLAILLPFHLLTPAMMHVLFLPDLVLLGALYLCPLGLSLSRRATPPLAVEPRPATTE